MAIPRPSERSQHGLDWLNFFVADVETGFGPFVSVYLTMQGWAPGAIGTVLSVNSTCALASQLPAGWVIDNVRQKRLVVAVCLACVAAGAMLIALFPHYLMVMVAETMHGLAGGAVRTAITAIALGLVGHRAYSGRLGRNHRYDSLGNGLTAAAMGGLGHLVSARTPFLAAAALVLPAGYALSLIRGREIDYARARHATAGHQKDAAPWRALLKNRTLVILGGCLFLFQFANASILPLAGERLAAGYKSESELVTSGMVVVSQLVAALIATWMARKADEWGRKPLLIVAFGALFTRTVLFALVSGPWLLVGGQALGGITAAVIGILTPLVVADSTKRTGRYNLAVGAVGTLGGVGATLSTTVMGLMAQAYGFGGAFAGLAAVSLSGIGMLWFLLPETSHEALEET